MADYFTKVKSSLQNAGASWSYQDIFIGEDEIRRFEVRPEDNWRAADGAKERSEVSSGEKLDFGQTYTLSYQFMLEPGARNTQDNVKIGQLHGTPDAKDSNDLGPVFALQLDGEKLKVVVRHDANAVTSGRVEDNFIYTDGADLVRGHWYNFQLVFRLDPQGRGLLEVWRDGVEITHYEGSLGYNDAVGPYWKQGVYRAGGSNVTLAVNFKNTALELGDMVQAAGEASETALVEATSDGVLAIGDVTKDVSPVASAKMAMSLPIAADPDPIGSATLAFLLPTHSSSEDAQAWPGHVEVVRAGAVENCQAVSEAPGTYAPIQTHSAQLSEDVLTFTEGAGFVTLVGAPLGVFMGDRLLLA